MKKVRGAFLLCGAFLLAFGGASPRPVSAADDAVQVEFGKEEKRLIERDNQLRERAVEELKRTREAQEQAREAAKAERQELYKKIEEHDRAQKERLSEANALLKKTRNPGASSIDQQLSAFESMAPVEEASSSSSEVGKGAPSTPKRPKIKRPPGHPILGLIPVSALEFEERGGDALRVIRKTPLTGTDSVGNRRVITTLPPGSRVFKNLEGVEAGSWVVEFYP